VNKEYGKLIITMRITRHERRSWLGPRHKAEQIVRNLINAKRS